MTTPPQSNPPRIEEQQESSGIINEGSASSSPHGENEEEDELSVFAEEDVDDNELGNKNTTTKTSDAEVVAVKNENYAVWGVRILVSLVLVGVAVAVCLVVAFREQDNEKEEFEGAFREVGNQFISAFDDYILQRMGIVQNFARELTSQFNSRKEQYEPNMTWPFFLPDQYFERAESTTHLARLTGLTLVPRVEAHQRDEWGAFVLANSGWLPDALIHQGFEGKLAKPIPTNPSLYTLTQGKLQPLNQTLKGPFFPMWLQWPVGSFHLTNLELYHNFKDGPPGSQFEQVFKTNKPSWPDLTFFDKERLEGNVVLNQIVAIFPDLVGDAVTSAFFPVYNELGEAENSSDNIVAFLMFGVAWNFYFSSILPPNSPEIDVVLYNQCGQEPTYRISGGISTPISRADVHQTKYDYLELRSDVNNLLGVDPETFEPNPGNCGYGIRVYPTSSFEDEYTTNGPLTYALSLAAVFVFTCAVFLLYDCMVERRQRAVMKSALQSGKLVSDLFPKEVREKLYQEQEALMKKEKEEKKRKANKDEWKRNTAESEDAPPESHPESNPNKNLDRSIAQLYPDCSIFFADIAGFTQWSSSRTPAEVFSLLETIYGAFDKLARRYNVFKVETIGDCYVAVTGLPEPQPDHAEILCKFARSCMAKFNLVIAELAETLGEDTATLEMRVGINSGEVTAGVLRGEKQRFQLFGDSVNTASRMESNGVKGRIHCSNSTAEALRVANKGHWVTPREDKIVAKGKGEMQTYFVNVSSGKTASNAGSTKNLGTSSSVDGDSAVANEGDKADPLDVQEQLEEVETEKEVPMEDTATVEQEMGTSN